ncbi:MAG TPA: CHRD domain-containing protein [Chloroflexaceae bacterium]|nr:CHRD domain-containing protein [Chloroflexaceae bacterium]
MRNGLRVVLLVVALLATVGVVAAKDRARFFAEADAAQEVAVPVMVDARAEAEAVFRLSEDGETLEYKLKIKRLNPVTQAHIHLAPPGVNGPIVVDLAIFAPLDSPTGNAKNTIVVHGTITAAQLRAGTPVSGPSLGPLLDAMRAGNTYVNVHTIVNRPGEVRGQIVEHAGH